MKILDFGTHKFMVVPGREAKVIFIHELFDLYKINIISKTATRITDWKKLYKFVENGCTIGFEIGF